MTITIIINVTIPASIFSLFDPRIDFDGLGVPLYPYGYPSGVLLKGFFINYLYMITGIKRQFKFVVLIHDLLLRWY
jgi:hypothetical protein